MEETGCAICVLCHKTIDLENLQLCRECLEKLQTHYAQLCKKCGKYSFIEWTEENIKELAGELGMPFEVLFETEQILIVPFKECDECNVASIWGEEYHGQVGNA